MIGQVLCYNVICSFVAPIRIKLMLCSSSLNFVRLLRVVITPSAEIQASVRLIGVNFSEFFIKGYEI